MIDNSKAQSTNTNPRIDEPNLKVLEDQLSFESMMNKKYNHYSSFCNDAQLKNLCHNAAQKHRENYIKLLNYLNSIK